MTYQQQQQQDVCAQCPPINHDTPHVFFTGLQASSLTTSIDLPATTWTALPTVTGTFVQSPQLLVLSAVTVNASITVERRSPGISQFRLVVDGKVVSVGSFESDIIQQFAPDMTTVALTWGGLLSAGPHTISIEYQNIETFGLVPQFSANSARSAGEGAFLTTLTIPFVPL